MIFIPESLLNVVELPPDRSYIEVSSDPSNELLVYADKQDKLVLVPFEVTQATRNWNEYHWEGYGQGFLSGRKLSSYSRLIFLVVIGAELGQSPKVQIDKFLNNILNSDPTKVEGVTSLGGVNFSKEFLRFKLQEEVTEYCKQEEERLTKPEEALDIIKNEVPKNFNSVTGLLGIISKLEKYLLRAIGVK